MRQSDTPTLTDEELEAIGREHPRSRDGQCASHNDCDSSKLLAEVHRLRGEVERLQEEIVGANAETRLHWGVHQKASEREADLRQRLAAADTATVNLASRLGCVTGHGDTIGDMLDEIAGQVEERLAAVERDRERLDWLDEKSERHLQYWTGSVREVIDGIIRFWDEHDADATRSTHPTPSPAPEDVQSGTVHLPEPTEDQREYVREIKGKLDDVLIRGKRAPGDEEDLNDAD